MVLCICRFQDKLFDNVYAQVYDVLHSIQTLAANGEHESCWIQRPGEADGVAFIEWKASCQVSSHFCREVQSSCRVVQSPVVFLFCGR